MKFIFYFTLIFAGLFGMPSCGKMGNSTAKPLTPHVRANVQEHAYIIDEAGIFPNPERGWFYTIDPVYDLNQTASPLTSAQLGNLKTQHNITLVRKYYVLADYLNTPTIPASFISTQLQNDLDVCRTAGFKLIPRFTYVWNLGFTATSSQDASLAITQGHIAQLMPVLNKNIDVVDHLHAGFVGRWGEFHTSTNQHVLPLTLNLASSGKAIIDSLLSKFSKKRMIAFRYPTFQQQIYGATNLTDATAFSGSHQARSGFHNDGFLYDDTDFGTWNIAYPNPDPARDYAKRFTKYTVMSGEPANANSLTAAQTLDEFRFYHFSSLSMNMPDAIKGGFYSGLKSDGNYDLVTRKLGYRYSVYKSSLPKKAVANATVPIHFSIVNNGWASNYNKRPVQLVLRNKANNTVYVKEINADPRYWFSAVAKDISDNISLSDIPKGSYNLFLNFPDPEPTLNSLPSYSIRLANVGIWEEATGYNSLQHELTIN